LFHEIGFKHFNTLLVLYFRKITNTLHDGSFSLWHLPKTFFFQIMNSWGLDWRLNLFEVLTDNVQLLNLSYFELI
jgi:hypothetical protein